MIIDPWGAVIAQCSEGEGIASAYIDLEYLAKIRRDMPVSQHRRYNLYGLVLSSEIHVHSATQSDAQPFGQFKVLASQIVMSSQLSFVAVNLKPVVPYHLLVIPKRTGADKLCDLTCDEIADLFNLVKKTQKLVEHLRGFHSSTIAIQDGEDAGQTVRHVHVHVLPRQRNDFPQNDDIYKELERHDKTDDDTRKARSEEEMKEEAEILRAHVKQNWKFLIN